MRSHRYGNHFTKLIDADAYYEHSQLQIERTLNDSNAVVRLAVLTDFPDAVLGFSVSRGTVLDYIFVHRDFRGLGIGKTLFPKDIDEFTHLTKIGLRLWSVKFPQAKFNPYV